MTTCKSIPHRSKVGLLLLAGILAAALPAVAEVRLPKIFTDNMMFQRDLPVRVWGWADAGEEVSVTLSGKSATTKADAAGKWKTELPALKEGENLELTVKGKNSLALKNVIIGDIWICGGQSNMEWALSQSLGAPEDIKAADFAKIRCIRINKVQSGEPQADAPAAGPWQVCSPATAGRFTAVGYYFAREIHQKTGVPIGIVDSNWGGTRIEPWVAAEGLDLVASLGAGRQEAMKAYQAQLPPHSPPWKPGSPRPERISTAARPSHPRPRCPFCRPSRAVGAACITR